MPPRSRASCSLFISRATVLGCQRVAARSRCVAACRRPNCRHAERPPVSGPSLCPPCRRGAL